MEILYGLHPVEEALRSGTRRFDHICIARERQDARLEKLIQACREAGVKLRLDTRDQLTKLAQTEAHQGVVAIVRKRQFLELDELLKGNKRDRLLLALDGGDYSRLNQVAGRTDGRLWAHGFLVEYRHLLPDR